MRDKFKSTQSLLLALFRVKVKLLVVLILIIVFFALGANMSNQRPFERIDKITVSQNKQIDDAKIDVTQAHLAKSIKIAGKAAPAPENKQYLVVFSSVENASSSAKQINYGDWFRLEEDGKKLAPLPINTSFVVPPKASLEKQLVFIVDKSKKAFSLLIGSLDKEPEKIEINF